MRSCSEHPLRALWTAHRHLKEPSTPIRVASLVLASEALWYLEYFEDARIAAQAAVEADPESAQARWRLAVALYRRSRFSDSAKCLDDLLRLVSRFGPAWALRGQVKVWLDPDNSDAGRSDFTAAAKLNSDSGPWVVPYRVERDDFEAKLQEEIRIRNLEVVGSSDDAVFTDVEWLPEESWVENGLDPDTRWYLPPVTGSGAGQQRVPVERRMECGDTRAAAVRYDIRRLSAEHRESQRGRGNHPQSDPGNGGRNIRPGLQPTREDRRQGARRTCRCCGRPGRRGQIGVCAHPPARDSSAR